MDHTENVQIVIDRDFNIMATNMITFDGGNLGKYIHKMKIAYLDESTLPVIGMISHHFDDPNLYIYGIDKDRQLVLVSKMQHIHKSRITFNTEWLWDISYYSNRFLLASSDGSLSEVRIKENITPAQ